MSAEPVEFHLGDEKGYLYLSDTVFEPNLTTKMLAEAADVREGDSVLELGCGVGPLAIYAAKKGASRVHAVDIMAEACAYARRNAELNGVADRVTVVQSNLFESVPGVKFDVIIDDVSGMSEEVSRISPWYPQEIPSGGVDGTDPTIDMLEQAREHLTENGRLYFPVISLSAWKKSLAKAHDIFGNGVELISEKLIPFCDEFKQALPALEKLKHRGLIDYEPKRSRYLWWLRIYGVIMNG